jgi:hypothetical protein
MLDEFHEALEYGEDPRRVGPCRSLKKKAGYLARGTRPKEQPRTGVAATEDYTPRAEKLRFP